MALNIRQLEIEKIKSIFNINTISSNNFGADLTWKILIYDQFGYDIVSTLFLPKELRNYGVTLSMMLDAKREPLCDVPAVYFVHPSKESIEKICKDIEQDLYASYHLNFISPISRDRLEEIAQKVVQTESMKKISQIFDRYTNFISLENDLFSMRCDTTDDFSFYAFNRSSVTESGMNRMIDQVVDSLFSVCVTLQVIPIIRCPTGNASELVARRLDQKIRDNLKSSSSGFIRGSGGGGGGASASSTSSSLFDEMGGGGAHSSGGHFAVQRPLLIILDRVLDMATPLYHSWAYQALIHDVLKMRNNRIEIDADSSNTANQNQHQQQQKPKTYNLWTNCDVFWSQQRATPFPELCESITSEMSIVKNKQSEMDQLRQRIGKGEDVAGDVQSSATSVGGGGATTNGGVKLNSVVKDLPEFMEKKRLLTMHTDLATILNRQIQARKLDLFVEMEEKLMNNIWPITFQERTFEQVVCDAAIGRPLDKMRLLLIGMLNKCINETEADKLNRQFCEALTANQNQSGDATSSGQSVVASSSRIGDEAELVRIRQIYAYVKRCLSIERSKLESGGGGATSASTGLGKTFSQNNLISKMIGKGQNIVMEGVKSLGIKKQKLPFTRIVDHLMEHKKDTTTATEKYLYFDPKMRESARGGGVPASSRNDSVPVQKAIVFVVGGGSYTEYLNMLAYCRKGDGRSGVAGGADSSSSGAAMSGVGGTSGQSMTGGASATAAGSGMSSSASYSNGFSLLENSSCKQIVYGCTELMSAKDFLNHLSNLGKEIIA